MAAVGTQDFIAQFHNLPGETVKDKHQNFFQLMNKNRTLTSDQLEFISKNLQSTNHLEKILRTDFLIYFRRFDELYEDFKTGDDVTVRKLSKQHWFFEKAFKEINCEDFTNRILPSAPYSLKLKILKKLPVQEERADEIFDAVSKRYGVFFATVLVPKCSVQKIHQLLTTYPIKLTVAQLKVICHKDPNLICVYLSEMKKLDEKCDFKNLKSLFKYIAQKHPEVFSALFQKYEFDIQLGRRTTKRFINCQSNTVSENIEDYINVLNKNVAVRKMGTQMKSILFKNCPKENEDYWMSLIKFYPKNKQFVIFESTYNSVHHYKFGENIDAISDYMLKLIPDKDKRDAFAKHKLEKKGIAYLQYLTPENCLKQVMEKLDCSRSIAREKFIQYATECCLLNKDTTSLLKICELVSGRLKNDDPIIRNCFLYALIHNTDIFHLFEQKQWTLVFDILATAQAMCEYVSDPEVIMSHYVIYLVQNKKCIKEVVRKYNDWLPVIKSTKINKEPKAHKTLLIELLEIGAPDKKWKEMDSAKFDCKLVYLCQQYNEQNPTDVIDVFDNSRVMKSVRHVLEEVTDTSYTSEDAIFGIKYIICQSREDVQELKKLYFQRLEKLGRMTILMWFLRNEPKTLQENFDGFLKTFAEVRGLNTKTFWKFIKKSTHSGLDKRTLDYCKHKMGEEGYKFKLYLVRALTILDSPSSHLQFVRSYVPVSDKVDLTDSDVMELFMVQGRIVKLLHFLKSPVEVLNATLDFYKGDYLSCALAPLYSCIYNIPEVETQPFIKRLAEIKAVSAKKHAMHLSCVIYDAKTVYDCLQTATVPSLMATLKYFVKNPTEDLWEILKAKIDNLTQTEAEMLKLTLDIKVPLKYRSQYIETVWNLVEKYDNKELKKLLVGKIDKKSTENFNPAFAFKVIKRCIFEFEDATSLIANIIVHLKTDEKFALLSDILSKFKKHCYNQPETRICAHQKLESLILMVFQTYMNSDEINEEFVSQFSILFSSVFSLSDAFQESVAIKLMTLKDAKPSGKGSVVTNANVDRCSKLLVELNDYVCKEFGIFAVRFFTNALSNTLFKHLFTSHNEQVRLCYSMLQYQKSVNNYLLILGLLPNQKPEGECFKQYEEICTELSRVSDNAVQLQFRSFLKSCSSEDGPLNWDQP